MLYLNVYFRQLKSDYPKKPGEFIMLDTGAKNISCYAFKSGVAGWCKVIDKFAQIN